MDEPSQLKSEKNLKDFFGSIPDFPERLPQGEYEEREILWNIFLIQMSE